MKNLIVSIALCASMAMFSSCSKESRDDAIERTARAARELNGSEKTGLAKDSDGEKMPDVVAEQKKKEKARQNSQWTPENQALHPVEYCQAQLEEVSKYARRLEVQAHQVAVAQSAAKRKISEEKGRIGSLGKFLEEVKSAYRIADATNKWPMTVNGYQISKEKAQKTIVETHQRLQTSQANATSQKNMLRKLENKFAQVVKEQKNLVVLREKIQATISDLQMKKLVDGEKGIGDALNAINDSMSALGEDASEPTLDDLMTPEPQAARQEAFDAIMAK